MSMQVGFNRNTPSFTGIKHIIAPEEKAEQYLKNLQGFLSGARNKSETVILDGADINKFFKEKYKFSIPKVLIEGPEQKAADYARNFPKKASTAISRLQDVMSDVFGYTKKLFDYKDEQKLKGVKIEEIKL